MCFIGGSWLESAVSMALFWLWESWDWRRAARALRLHVTPPSAIALALQGQASDLILSTCASIRHSVMKMIYSRPVACQGHAHGKVTHQFTCRAAKARSVKIWEIASVCLASSIYLFQYIITHPNAAHRPNQHSTCSKVWADGFFYRLMRSYYWGNVNRQHGSERWISVAVQYRANCS